MKSYAAAIQNMTLAKLLNVSVKSAIQNVVDISEKITVSICYARPQQTCGYIGE